MSSILEQSHAISHVGMGGSEVSVCAGIVTIMTSTDPSVLVSVYVPGGMVR